MHNFLLELCNLSVRRGSYPARGHRLVLLKVCSMHNCKYAKIRHIELKDDSFSYIKEVFQSNDHAVR